METIDLTPDPKILIALTHTPMKPLDALCELIDNAIDSFSAAQLQGSPINGAMVIVDLPKLSEISAGNGKICIRDNGPGMTLRSAEKALKAGYSGNNPYDSLGLFGMGFNISTGKLGIQTRLLTATKDDKKAVEVVVNLEDINKARSFATPVKTVDKPPNFECGTLVEISGWWPEGNPNCGFARKLVQYGASKIREELGRTYATHLREKQIQLVVAAERVKPFEHCVWGPQRFVERQGHGKIYAIQAFDETVGQQIRCTSCYARLESAEKKCPACKMSGSRTISERVRGWVGVQRYDDPSEFGIDLIRNGRCIRMEEKQAFFEFVDDFKKSIKDYPIDQTFGRIVGEVHLNHIPVDFMKQDFQRSSPEWHRAVKFLRGETSLQPKQAGATKNSSPIYRLYQGYRKVRNGGKAELYMGFWDSSVAGPTRISREKEREFRKNFEDRKPGYYDDSKWWDQVIAADQKPLDELIDCPQCKAQNLKNADICVACAFILQPKACANGKCGAQIPMSAQSCPSCGESQSPELRKKWRCGACGHDNLPELDACSACNSSRGALNPLSVEFLRGNSDESDRLSIPACSVQLADGSSSSQLKVRVSLTRAPIVPAGRPGALPLVSFREPGEITIFLDASHSMFRTYQVRPEEAVAGEVAQYLFELNRHLIQHQGLHTPINIQWQILRSRWAGDLELSAERLQKLISAFLDEMREQLPLICDGLQQDIFSDLTNEDQRDLVAEMLRRGEDLAKLEQFKASGAFLRFISADAIGRLLEGNADRFFDGKFWKTAFAKIPGLSDDVLAAHREQVKALYLNCMRDVIAYRKWSNPDPALNRRADAALLFLRQDRI